MKEYGGVLYIASLSPSTGMCEIGSIPAPVDKITANELNKTENVNYN